MVTFASVNEAPTGLNQRFFGWVNERQWRVRTLIGVLALLHLLWMGLAVLAGYLGGYLVGDLTFLGLRESAPAFVAAVYTGEVMGGSTFFDWGPWLLYVGIAITIIGAMAMWQDKYGPVNTTVADNGWTITSPKGPSAFIWGSVTLGLIVPFIMGLVTGFW